MSEPRKVGLLNMLGSSSGTQFVIPVYQRNYTWTANKETAQYLKDLDNVIKGRYNKHFLGIIIYLEKPIDFATREYSVIDGQQRLTTTFLMLYAIKKILEEDGETDIVEQLDSQYLTNPFHSDKVKFKLKPLVSDDDVYRCIVNDEFDKIENKKSNILLNYNYIRAHILNLIESGVKINDILMAMNQLYVVCVPIDNDDDPQKIFESINATGAKLTAADLIRNYLLMDLESDIQEQFYKNYWKSYEDYISPDPKELETFFRMFLATQTFILTNKKDIYTDFVDWIEGRGCETKDILEEILVYARIYNSIYISDIREINPILKPALEDFRRVHSDLPMPVVMEFFKLNKNGLISVKTLSELISTINAYMIRRSFCDINSQNVSRLFPTILKKVLMKLDGNFEEIVTVFNQELVGNNAGTSGSYMPTDKQMMELLFNANVYKRTTLKLILDRLELADNPAPVDLTALSIEHLMPQTPTAEWLESLDVDEETYLNNLHRLGNLTLASKSDNSKMSNSTWDYKNSILKSTAHLKLNMELMNISHWTISEIDKRTEDLIKRICELYPYPNVECMISKDADIIDETKALELSRKHAIDEEVKEIKKNRVFKSIDGTNGYVLVTSKVYPQSDYDKYWFTYQESRFEKINDCLNKYLIFSCRSDKTMIIKLPLTFIETYEEYLNSSLDENGKVAFYHINILKHFDGRITFWISFPEGKEIDISEFLVAEV